MAVVDTGVPKTLSTAVLPKASSVSRNASKEGAEAMWVGCREARAYGVNFVKCGALPLAASNLWEFRFFFEKIGKPNPRFLIKVYAG
jgi:hypothetical protein